MPMLSGAYDWSMAHAVEGQRDPTPSSDGIVKSANGYHYTAHHLIKGDCPVEHESGKYFQPRTEVWIVICSQSHRNIYANAHHSS